MDRWKKKVIENVSKLNREYSELVQWIYENPELGFREYKASKKLQRFLTSYGFSVINGIAGLETAFRAEKGISRGPKIGLACEFDAQPEVGHACGHNVIGVASAAAAIAASAVLEEFNGTIVVMGTPAGENGGGKKILLDKGAMDDLDCLMMFHPGPKTVLCEPTLAICVKHYIFRGKGAHAAVTPFLGRNALDAVVQMYVSVNAMRGILSKGEIINGIITKGGVSTNMIPDVCEATYEMRAETGKERKNLEEKVENCARAAAKSTGCTVEIQDVSVGYDEMWPSHVIVDLLEANMTELGDSIDVSYSDTAIVSTDMGNVSHRIPVIHSMYGIGKEAMPHTPQFAEACSGENAVRMVGGMARALSTTVVDLLEHTEKLSEAKQELNRRKELKKDGGEGNG